MNIWRHKPLTLEQARRVAWWSFVWCLVSLAVPFVIMGLHELHNWIDPHPPGFLSGLGRLLGYLLGAYLLFGAVQLVSLWMGMKAARRSPRVLWRLVPQFVVVSSLYCFINTAFIVDGLPIGLGMGLSDQELLFGLTAISTIGSMIVAGLWTQWVLSLREWEQTNDEVMT